MENYKYYFIREDKNGNGELSEAYDTPEIPTELADSCWLHLTDREKKNFSTFGVAKVDINDPNNANGLVCDIDEIVRDYTKFYIQDSEAGNVIEVADTYKEATQIIEQYEEQDRVDGTYKEDFYEVADVMGSKIY